MTGTAVSQMIGLAVTPILTRNYSPKDFGILLIYISILTIAGTISTGKYERVILLLKFNSDIKRVVLLSLFISLMAGMFLLILTLTSKQLIVEYLSFDITYYNWIITIPFLLVVYSQYIVFSTLCKRPYTRRNFRLYFFLYLYFFFEQSFFEFKNNFIL